MKLDEPAIAARLKRLRKAHEISQADLCRTTQLLASQWSQYESGKRMVTLEASIVLRQKFGASLDWIYFGEEANLPKRLADLLNAK